MKRGRGRPPRDKLDEITEAAAVRYVVDRDRDKTGQPIKTIQGQVAKETGTTDRKIRTAYEFFGRLQKIFAAKRDN